MVALAVGAAVLGALGLALPKVLVVTPADFNPVIKVSALDLLQARMLGKTARKLESEGRPKEALVAWAGALGNNPANVNNLRSFVEFTLREEGLERRWITIGAQQGHWLVSLVGTNDASALELAGRMCARAGFDEQAWSFLNRTNRTVSIPAARALAEVAFKTGRLKEFVDLWERRQADLEGEPALGLYRSAWLALNGAPSEQASHLSALDRATAIPSQKATALRLRSMVEAQRLDVEGFQRSFEELRSIREDRLEDHVRYWLMLDAAGDRAAAVGRATAYAVPPETGQDAAQLLLAWGRLRLEQLAVGFAQNQLDAFPDDPLVWLRTSQMLINVQNWDELRLVVFKLRRSARLSFIFAGYIDFLEGAAEAGLGRDRRARELFTEMLKRLPSEPMLGLDASTTLERLGYRPEAQSVLESLESVFGNQARYWYDVGRLAWQERDSNILLKSAEKAYALDPKNLEHMNNLAAALLIARVRPGEALQLTMQLAQEVGYAHGVIINHAFALTRVGRVPEARKLLDELPLTALTDEERTFWRMAMLEIELEQGNAARAQTHLRGIDSQYLYPSQKTWLEQVQSRLKSANP